MPCGVDMMTKTFLLSNSRELNHPPNPALQETRQKERRAPELERWASLRKQPDRAWHEHRVLMS